MPRFARLRFDRIPPTWMLLAAAAVAHSAGCAAAKATVHLSAAEKAVDRAREHHADEQAVYEYTLALRYLEKAHEEAGYSDFRDVVELSQAAADFADQAIIAIEKRGNPAPAAVEPTAPAGQ